jgi:hypothetical protein
MIWTDSHQIDHSFPSSHFTRKTALVAGVTDTSFQALRPFAAEGITTVDAQRG